MEEEYLRREELLQADHERIAYYQNEFCEVFAATEEWICRLAMRRDTVLARPFNTENVENPVLLNRFDMSQALSTNPLRFLQELHGYAWFGLMPRRRRFQLKEINWNNPTSALVVLSRLFDYASEWVEEVPQEFSLVEQSKRVIVAASGRLNLDKGKNLSVDEHAGLAKVAKKTISNLCLPSAEKRRLPQDQDRTIRHAESLRWLSGREDFLPTLFVQPPEMH